MILHHSHCANLAECWSSCGNFQPLHSLRKPCAKVVSCKIVKHMKYITCMLSTSGENQTAPSKGTSIEALTKQCFLKSLHTNTACHNISFLWEDVPASHWSTISEHGLMLLHLLICLEVAHRTHLPLMQPWPALQFVTQLFRSRMYTNMC